MDRKWIALLLSCLLLLTVFAACGTDDTATPNDQNDQQNDQQNSGNLTPPTSTPNQPGTGMNSGSNSMTPDTPNDDRGEYPTFPNALADANADVGLDDLIGVLGLTATDLETAMRDVSTVGDSVEGAKTYRHKLLGHESDVSYNFDSKDTIDNITVKAAKDRAEDWRKELNDVRGATAIEGQTDTWDYSNNQVKITEEGDNILITIKKNPK